MDFALAILADPQRSLGPRESRRAIASGRRDAGKHAAGCRVDLVDAARGNLKEMLAVEGCARIGGDFDCAHSLAARGIECVQRLARCNPDLLAVVGDAGHLLDVRERTVFADDSGV